MGHIKLFKTASEYEEYMSGEPLLPNVSLVEENNSVLYNQLDIWDTLPSGVYKMDQFGMPMIDGYITPESQFMVNVLIDNEVPVPQKFMVSPVHRLSNNVTSHSYMDSFYEELTPHQYAINDITGLRLISDGPPELAGSMIDIPKAQWTNGALGDFSGKLNTEVLKKSYKGYPSAQLMLSEINFTELGFNDWYLPSCGQAMLIAKANSKIASYDDTGQFWQFLITSSVKKFSEYWQVGNGSQYYPVQAKSSDNLNSRQYVLIRDLPKKGQKG